MLRSSELLRRALKDDGVFHLFFCVWRCLTGTITSPFRIGSNYLWMCEICWSSKNLTNHLPSGDDPVVLEVGDDPQWGDLWKSGYSLRGEKCLSPKKVSVNNSTSVFKCVCFRQVFVFNLSAAIWLWLVTAVYFLFWSYLFDCVCRSVATLCLMVVLFV